MTFLNPTYKVRNLLVLNTAGFSCIALVVFLLATQPFYLSDVIGIAPENVGSAIATLGAVDELVAIIVAPLLGTFNDRINGWAWKGKGFASGSRILQLVSFSVLAVSMLGYGHGATKLFPDVWFWRAVFAVGVSGCMSIVTVMLHEVNNSDFRWGNIAFWKVGDERSERLLRSDEEHNGENPEISGDFGDESRLVNGSSQHTNKKQGSLAALLGISTGLGAVFSVLCFLTLPVRLTSWYPDLTSRESLKLSYSILGCFAVGCGLVVFTFAYDCVRQRRASGHSPELELPETTYIEMLKEGLAASKNNSRIQLAYVAAFVSRSTTVATAVFIPLMVYKFFYNSGQCGAENPQNSGIVLEDLPLRNNCYDGYVFLAILTGVAQTVALLSSPLWGMLVDSKRLGSRATLVAASACGMLGTFGLCFVGRGDVSYDPRTVTCFVLVSFIGLSQIGTIIASMSIVSSIGQTAERSEHRVIGSISGLYSLCGGVGILVITIVGGRWSDRWVFGPFLLLGVFNAILAGVATRRRK